MAIHFSSVGKTIDALRNTAKNCPDRLKNGSVDVYGAAIVNTMSEVFPSLVDAYDKLSDEQVLDLHTRLTIDAVVATHVAIEAMSWDQGTAYTDRVLASIDAYEESCLSGLSIIGVLDHG